MWPAVPTTTRTMPLAAATSAPRYVGTNRIRAHDLQVTIVLPARSFIMSLVVSAVEQPEQKSPSTGHTASPSRAEISLEYVSSTAGSMPTVSFSRCDFIAPVSALVFYIAASHTATNAL